MMVKWRRTAVGKATESWKEVGSFYHLPKSPGANKKAHSEKI